MRNKNFKITGMVFSVFLLLNSCSEEFLNTVPIAMETEDVFYDDFASVDLTVTSAYSRLRYLGYDYTTMLTMQGPSDDMEIGGDNAGDGREWKEMEQYIHNSNNPKYDESWGVNYKGIRLANTALNYLPNYIEEEPQLVPQRIAEMQFLRAFYHFSLMEMFGGIPIVDHVLSPPEFSLGRSSIAEVLHFVQTELEAAYPYLLTKSALGSNEFGRISQGAAQSLLAKVYLYESSYAKYHAGNDMFAGCEQKFDLASKHAEEVISSGEYYLEGLDGERKDSWWAESLNSTGDGTVGAFRWIFTVDGDNSGEAVFEIQNSMDGRGWAESTGNGLTQFMTARFCEANVNSSWYGWGFNVATSYLKDAFTNSDARENGLSPENQEVIGQYDDPRFGTTAGLQGDLMLIRILAGAHSSNGTLEWSPMVLDNVPAQSAYRKYEAHPDESLCHPAMNANESGPINWKLIRFADVVLMAAEAAFESGNAGRALELVNLVRQRARNSHNDPSDVNYQIYPKVLSGITFADIMHERRLEFALENSRFQDVVRWNKANEYFDGVVLALTGASVNFDETKHFFMPLPNSQVQLSKGGLVQYPGWE